VNVKKFSRAGLVLEYYGDGSVWVSFKGVSGSLGDRDAGEKLKEFFSEKPQEPVMGTFKVEKKIPARVETVEETNEVQVGDEARYNWSAVGSWFPVSEIRNGQVRLANDTTFQHVDELTFRKKK
jgi:hypothetical protein